MTPCIFHKVQLSYKDLWLQSEQELAGIMKRQHFLLYHNLKGVLICQLAHISSLSILISHGKPLSLLPLIQHHQAQFDSKFIHLGFLPKAQGQDGRYPSPPPSKPPFFPVSSISGAFVTWTLQCCADSQWLVTKNCLKVTEKGTLTHVFAFPERGEMWKVNKVLKGW